MDKGPKRVLVVGEINIDLICQGYHAFPSPGREVLVDDFRMVLGSASAICAMGLARLGTPVAFFGKVGDDPAGHFCLDAMRARGIDLEAVVVDPGLKTGVTVAITSTVDRALVSFLGSIASMSERDVPRALFSRADHVHVSSFYLQEALRPGVAKLFRDARAAGLTTSLDPGFDPSERWDPDLHRHAALRGRVLPQRGRAARAHRIRRSGGGGAAAPEGLDPRARRREARRAGSHGDRRRRPAGPRSGPAGRGHRHDGRRGLVRRGLSPRLARAARSSPTVCGSAWPAAPSRHEVSGARPRRRISPRLGLSWRRRDERRGSGAPAGPVGVECRAQTPPPRRHRLRRRPARRRRRARAPGSALRRLLLAGPGREPARRPSHEDRAVPRPGGRRAQPCVRGDGRAGRRVGRVDGPDRRPHDPSS